MLRRIGAADPESKQVRLVLSPQTRPGVVEHLANGNAMRKQLLASSRHREEKEYILCADPGAAEVTFFRR